MDIAILIIIELTLKKIILMTGEVLVYAKLRLNNSENLKGGY